MIYVYKPGVENNIACMTSLFNFYLFKKRSLIRINREFFLLKANYIEVVTTCEIRRYCLNILLSKNINSHRVIHIAVFLQVLIKSLSLYAKFRDLVNLVIFIFLTFTFNTVPRFSDKKTHSVQYERKHII